MKRLFWDIETSPCTAYIWRPGYKIRVPNENVIKKGAIICIAYKWEGKNKTHAMSWLDGNDRPMVAAFLEVAKTADELVAHNGDKFDMKWVRTQCVRHEIPAPPQLKTVDTLTICRRYFNFTSNRLNDIAQDLLGDQKIHTEFEWWKEIDQGNEETLKKMVRYCRKDVRLLEKVYEKIAPFAVHKTHVGVQLGNGKWSCAWCGSKKVKTSKINYTAMGTQRPQMKCKKCGRYYTISALSHRQYIEA